MRFIFLQQILNFFSACKAIFEMLQLQPYDKRSNTMFASLDEWKTNSENEDWATIPYEWLSEIITSYLELGLKKNGWKESEVIQYVTRYFQWLILPR